MNQPRRLIGQILGAVFQILVARFFKVFNWLKRKKAEPAADYIAGWRRVLEGDYKYWTEKRELAANGPRVLLAPVLGGGTSVSSSAIEGLLAVALTLRGARVEILLCDQALPACKNLEIATISDPRQILENRLNELQLCRQCRSTGDSLFGLLALPIHRISDAILPAEIIAIRQEAADLSHQELCTFTRKGRPLGEHALAGVLRYFARGNLDVEKQATEILRRYLEAALIVDTAMHRLLEARSWHVCLCSHGLYVPHGVVNAACRGRAIPVVNWSVAYRKQRFIFSHGDTYHHTLMDEPVSEWENLPWDECREKLLVEYLESRITGSNDWIWFFERPHHDLDEVASRLGLDLAKPIIGLLTNVIWDAQLHYPANAFPDMMEWIHATIDYFQTRPDLQLVIRIHPAEIRGTVPSRQGVLTEIKKRWKNMPANVFVVQPEEQISTYTLMQRCDSVLIYGTKTGVELACSGIPLIVAGEAWIRNKGLTRDAGSPEEYRKLLSTLPLGSRHDAASQLRARRYAYHFFFRRMIPIEAVKPSTGTWPPFRIAINHLSELAEGVDPGLDVICKGVLDGTPFVYNGDASPSVPVSRPQEAK